MRVLFGVMAALAIGCSGDAGDGGEPLTREEQILSLSADVASGEALYGTNCEVCHGVGGAGGVGPTLVGKDAPTVVTSMLEPPSGMTAFESLEDQEIADIAGYVETL